MYFADHRGDRIKLAYVNSPEGPWQIYQPGTLRLDQADAFFDHIASPDVHVDEGAKQIRMYFHGVAHETGQQQTGISFSTDGITFNALRDIQGLFYYRVFEHNGWYYAIAKNNNEGFMAIYRARTGVSDLEFGRNFLPDARHAAVRVEDNKLEIYYSRVGIHQNGSSAQSLILATIGKVGSPQSEKRSYARSVLMKAANILLQSAPMGLL